MSTYVVSDIHGQFDLFLKGLESVSFKDADHLWVIGDAIDRGPDGIRLLQYIMQHDNMDLIIGNHELMMLNSVDPDGGKEFKGSDADLWIVRNGGEQTYSRYCELPETERRELLDWLRNRYVIKTLEIGGQSFCLTHSYYKPSCENKRYCELSYNDVWLISWSSIWRSDFLTHAMDIYPKYDYTFITGHVPVQVVRTMQGEKKAMERIESVRHGNLINIDGGCAIPVTVEVRKGLIFLRMDNNTEFIVGKTV